MNLKTTLAAGAALVGTAAFADFEINLDLGEKPIRDARTSTCGPMVGYAGCLADTDEAYEKMIPEELRRADHCTGCGRCNPHCPQQIDILDGLAEDA